MPITGPDPPATAIGHGALRTRNEFLRLTVATRQHLGQIRDLVAKYGRSELAAELGADAAAMVRVYNAYKAILDSDDVPGTCPDLPS